LPIATEKQRLAAAIQRDEARRIAIEYRQAAGEGMSALPPKADIRMQMRPHCFYFPPMTIAQ
jgi:hypothetical protein